MKTNLQKLQTKLRRLFPNTRFQIESFLKQEISESMAALLLNNAVSLTGYSARLIKMADCECHGNAIKLVNKNPKWSRWFGLALSEDGCWRVHSWCKNTRGRIVETTIERSVYYGLRVG